MNRIKFYSVNDMGSGLMLAKLPMLIETFNKFTGCTDVNDALEFYNICLFIRNKLWLVSWTDQYKEELRSLEKPIFASAAQFFLLQLVTEISTTF